MRWLALLALVTAACAQSAPARSLALPLATPPAAVRGDDLVYLADYIAGPGQDVPSAGVTIITMPSGAVVGHVEGDRRETFGARFGLIASPPTRDVQELKVTRVELATGRSILIDVATPGTPENPFESWAVAGAPDGSRTLVAHSFLDKLDAMTSVDVFDAAGKRVASRTWTDSIPPNAIPTPSIWPRLVALDAGRYLLVRTRDDTGPYRELSTWSVIDADLHELASVSSDASWVPGSHGGTWLPAVSDGQPVLWSPWCDPALLAVPGRGMWAMHCTTSSDGADPDHAVVFVDSSLRSISRVALPHGLGGWYGWTARSDSVIVAVGGTALARVDPATLRVESDPIAAPRSFELFPIALAKIAISPMLQFNPDGRLAYLITWERVRDRAGIAVVDTSSGALRAELLKGEDVRGVRLSADGTRLYALVGDSETSQQARLVLVDPSNGVVLSRTDLFARSISGIVAVATRE